MATVQWFLLTLAMGTLGFILDGNQCLCPAVLSDNAQGYETKTYSKLDDNVNVVNPGRGFYAHIETKSSAFTPLDSSSMDGSRNTVLRLYYLDSYINSDLDMPFISKVKADMETIKQNGWMVILRFAYTTSSTAPYGDANLSRVLQHIASLDSNNVFRTYEGVIAAIQAGFIGAWGEWYYANADFGIPGSCSATFGLTNSQWDARHKTLLALLKAAPATIEVLVRIPAFKYHLWGKNVTVLAEDRIHSEKSRIGFHNDAFLSDDTDQGTFVCSGDKEYMANDSIFNVVVGETDDISNPSRYSCGNALSEMSKYHYSLLNGDYHAGVINAWKQQGCYQTIAAKLGYRLHLTKSVLPNVGTCGGLFCYKIDIQNSGFAAPYKELEAHLVLQSMTDGKKYGTRIANDEARTWQPGTTHTLTGSARIPQSLRGYYKIYFALLHNIMQKNSKYYILMANTNGVQNAVLRMNDLLHVINITTGSCSNDSTPEFTPWESVVENCISRNLSDGSFENNVSGWSKYSGGFTVIAGADAYDGSHYIRVTNGGALQIFDFKSSPVSSFRLSGYSRHSSTASISAASDYSIYCDLVNTDGSMTYGKTSNFDISSTPSVWHLKELQVAVPKPIAEAWCYAMFRNGQGYADFDQFTLNTC